jgi:hypothetical protein
MKKILNRQSNKILYNGIRFDSTLEYDTYQILLKEFGFDDIEVHKPVLIKFKTDHFRAINLKFDFYIKSIDLYIESKGILEYDFSLKLAMLDSLNPTILNKLIIVVREVDDTFRRFSKTHDLLILPINQLQQNLKIQRNYYDC